MNNIKKLALLSFFINYAHITTSSEEMIFGNNPEQPQQKVETEWNCYKDTHKEYREQGQVNSSQEQSPTQNHKRSDDKLHSQED